MNQIAKTFSFALAAFALSTFSPVGAQESERAPQQEEVGEQAPNRKDAARERVMQRLQERGFTKEDLERAKEVMKARREVVREVRAENGGQRRGGTRAVLRGQRGARAQQGERGRRGIQRQRGQRGRRGMQRQRRRGGQGRGMRGGRQGARRQRRR